MEMEPSVSAEVACKQFPSFPPSFPSYKRIPGTRFVVDGFRHAGPWSHSYFLSHFHSDHYTGLTPLWNRGIIYCSHITARLVLECMKVSKQFVHALLMGESVHIDSSIVTLVDANHCPGAVQFLFQVPAEKKGAFSRYVHTGDMRFSSDMKADPCLCDFVGADAVFLDTTYCNPKFIFPTQSESISYIVDTIFTVRKDTKEEFYGLTHIYDDSDEADEVLIANENFPKEVIDAAKNNAINAKENVVIDIQETGDLDDDAKFDTRNSAQVSELSHGQNRSTLFLISTYVIGKEKILSAIAKRCKCLIYVNEKKLDILHCLELEDLDIFTTCPSATNVHVVSWNSLGETWPFFRPNFRKMEELLKKSGCDRVIGFVPTGWTYDIKKSTFSVRRKGPLEIHLVPYSEHSNYQELREFVAFLRPHEIFPTVGLEGGDMDSKAVSAMRKHFRNLVDETASKRRFLKGFSRKNGIGSSDSQGRKLKRPNLKSELYKPEPICNHSSTDDPGLSTDIQKVSNSLNLMDTTEFPNVTFGRGAKKRQRDGHKNADCELFVPVSASQDNLQAEIENSPDICHVLLETGQGSTGEIGGHNKSQEKKIQLRTVLPGDVDDNLLDSLLLKADGNLDLAVTLYFEGSHDDQQWRASDKKVREELFEENNLCDDTGIQRSLLDRECLSKSHSSFKNKTNLSVIKRTRKSQASILTFFKKSNSKATCSGSADTVPSMSKDMEADQVKDEGLLSKSPSKAAGIDQIMTILGGTVTLDKAQALLQQSLGDHVGLAEKEHMCKATAREIKKDYVATSIWEYKPIEFACWTRGEPAPYIHLARTFDLVEQESGRLKTSDMLCNMFRSLIALSPDAVLPAIYLSTNRIAPDYEKSELSIGGSIVSDAIVEATGTQKLKIKEMYNSIGDLGDVAQACRQTQSLLVAPSVLSIQQVFSTLILISKETGSGSNLRKKSLILGLLRACREKEMKYIVRTLVQNLRIGAMMRSILPALAQAIVLRTSDTKSDQLKHEILKASSGIMEAYNFMPNLNILVPALMQDGIETVLSNVAVSPGIPVKPMLAKITNGLAEVFKRFQGKPFTCEYKYDGQRAQVHLVKDGTIKIFSRNCEDTTLRFPDVVDIVRMAVRPGTEDLIFDAEIVAVDRHNNNKLMAFQHLSTRERGRSGEAVSIENIKVEVCLFVFDLMYANGKPLVKATFGKRRERMQDCFGDSVAGCFGFANQITIEGNEAKWENTSAVTRVESFLEEAINSSCEGIMVKALDEESAYAPSKRSDSWLKVKKDYIDGLHDTLDLVPIGAWHGNGRKAGWFSPFLLACYDADREEYQSVCRVMSGFTDAFYKQMKIFFSDERLLQRKPAYYQTLEEPDVWFSPELVWEIRGADLTVSPVHQAAVGLVHPLRGISLRFPRFIKERSDKKLEDASTPSEIADMFQQQNRKLDLLAQQSEGPHKKKR